MHCLNRRSDTRTAIRMAALALLISLALPSPTLAHCQIPCGIYDDAARVKALLEDVATIEKAVSEIAQLADNSDPQSLNQQVRWVVNKEHHAQRIITTLADYFLTQRIKPSQEDYAERLQKHHTVILAAMKAKQSAGMAEVQALKASVEALQAYYPEHKH